MRRLAASLPRAFVAARNGHVEGGPVGHPRAVSVFDGPLLHVLVVEEAHGVVVADARPAPGFQFWVADTTASGSPSMAGSLR